jgi:hypothetical protein
MDEKELFEAWKGTDKNESQVFEQHKDEFIQLAQKQSNDIFSKIKRNIVWEGVLSIIVGVSFPVLFLSNPIFFWIIIVLIVVALLVGINVYGKYWRDMKQLDDSSLIVSLEKKLAILTRYIKQLKIYLYLFMPLGFVVGVAFALKQEEIDLTRMIVIIAVTLPFLGIMLWLGKKYIHALYGKHLKNIEGIYKGLKEK